MRSLLRLTSYAAALFVLAGVSVQAQDFSRNFQLAPEGSVNIQNVSGDVSLSGYDGNVITVVGTKKGRDREMLQVEDRSTVNRIDIRVKYPENCNCDASIDFEVRVPKGQRYSFDSVASVSGSVSVAGVTGDLKARSVSGEVIVKNVSGRTTAMSVSGRVIVEEAAGSVSAKSTSGEVVVLINRLEGTEPMDFSSVSGSVNVKLPSNLDANVEMSVLTGDLKTDFPLQIEEKERGPGRRASGTIGSGARKLSLKSVSGSVSLLKL
ncbi:MAG: DUF4097 family beta strand repeat-containing protein [Acidobacteriota bacterium]